MQTGDFLRYMIAMQGVKLPMQRVDMDIPASDFDREEDRRQSVKVALAWEYDNGHSRPVVLDPHAINWMPNKPMFLHQTMSFRVLTWNYDEMTDEVYNSLIECTHPDNKQCTPLAHGLTTAYNHHYMYLVNFADIRKFYIRWLRRRCLLVLTCLEKARKATIAHEPQTPLQRLVCHPYYDRNIWRTIFAAAYPKLPQKNTRQPAAKRRATTEASVDLQCLEERVADIITGAS
jgi:hypothetical protein